MGGMGMAGNVATPNSMPIQTNQPQGPSGMLQSLIFNSLYQRNPQFRQFADSMRGKTPEQAFQEQGLDYNQYRDMDANQIKNMLGF